MSNSSGGLSGLDRKAMEAERLARLAKKRSATPSSNEDPAKKAPRIDAQARPIPDSSQTTTSSQGTMKAQNFDESESAADGKSISPLEFPNGVIRNTWAFGHERKNDIKIEEVLRKKDLKTAVISAFCWNFDWLVTKFDTQNTKFIFVMQARNEYEKQTIQNDFKEMSKTIRLCFPPLSGHSYACMHSKLMLLFYPTHLRVVVPSANFVPYDWGETGVMENSVFLIDLPRLPEAKQGHVNDTLTQFSKELMRFLDAMGIHEDVTIGMLNFDFTQTSRIQFVHTIGGSHLGSASKYTGFPGLARAVRGLDLENSTDLEVDMAASSVGAVDLEFIATLYRALRGLEPIQPSPPSRNKAPPNNAPNNSVTTRFRIVFPSRETIQESTGGPANGGTIFLKPEYYQRSKFPSKLIRDYKSCRTGLISHNKLIFARSATSAFLYMGSANLSSAAWGRLSYDKASKGPKLIATNWECGVLMPAHLSETTLDDNNQEPTTDSEAKNVLPIDVFEKVFPVPFKYPAKPYDEGQLPWCAGT